MVKMAAVVIMLCGATHVWLNKVLFMRLTSLILLLSFALQLSGSEFTDWCERAFEIPPAAVKWIGNYDEDHHKFRDDYLKNAQYGIYSKEDIPSLPHVQINDENITINKKKLSFKAIDPKDFSANGSVLKLVFNLDKEQPISVWEESSRNYHRYQAMYLNGKALSKNSMELWTLKNTGSPSMMGKKGKNVLFAISSQRTKYGKISNLHVVHGDLKERSVLLAEKIVNLDKKESKDHLQYIIDQISRYRAIIDGKTMAEGFFYYLHSYQKQTDEKSEATRKNEITNWARTCVERIDEDARLEFNKILRRRAPKWLMEKYYLNPWKQSEVYWNYLQRDIDAVARRGTDSSAMEQLRYMLGIVKPKITSDKVKGQLRDFYHRCVTYTLRYNALFDSILDLNGRMKDLPGYKKNSWQHRGFKSVVGDSEQRIQSKAQLAGNPEAQQHYNEFKLLMNRGSDDDRAVDSVVTIFRRAGQKLMLEGNSMRTLGTEMLIDLSTDKAFYDKVTQRAHAQFSSRVSMALQRGNLSEMGELIKTYGLLVNTDTIHKSLMDEYLDRCKYDRARYHAMRLIESENKELQANAFSKLLFIEHILNMSPQERTPIPSKVLKSKIIFMGEEQSIGSLQNVFNGKGVVGDKRVSIDGPGSHLSSHQLGMSNGVHNYGNGEFLEYLPYEKQCIEPISLNNAVYTSSPTHIRSFDVQKKSTRWAIDQDVAVQPYSSGLASVSYPSVIVNGNIVRMWSAADGEGFSISAFDQDGRVVWDFYDHQVNQKWSPVCTPHSAFGILFGIAYNRNVRDQLQFALLRIDSSNGKVESSIPINTMFAGYKVEKSRHAQHFFSDKEYLYGLSGSGTMFKINRTSLQLDWVAGQTLRHMRHTITPAAFIRPYSNTIVAFMPNIQEWVGVNKRSGRQKWRWKPNDHCYIHSRNSSDALIISNTKNTIMRVDPETGEIVWRKHGMGIRVTGEGCLQGDDLYIPSDNGFAIYQAKTGEFKEFHPTPYTPNKIRRDAAYWYLLTKNDIHIHAYGKTFQAGSPKISKSLGIDQPINQKSHKEKSFVLTSNNYISKTILSPLNIDGNTKFRKTSLPFYYILDKYREQGIGLYREAHTDAKGNKVDDKIMWIDSKKSYGLYGDKIAFWDKKHIRVEQLPNREVLLERHIDRDYKVNDVQRIIVNNDVCAIYGTGAFGGGQRLIFVDLKTGAEKSRLNFGRKSGAIYGDRKIILINSEADKAAVAFDTSTGKQLWKFDKKERSWATKIADNTMMLADHRKEVVWIIKIDSGQILHGPVKTRSFGATYANGMIFAGRTGVLNMKTGKGIGKVKKVIIARGKGAAVIQENKPIMWHDKDGSIELQKPAGSVYGHLAYENHDAYAYANAGIIHLFSNSSYASYDRKTGKIIASNRLSGNRDGRFVAFLNNSALYLNRNHIYVLRSDGKLNFPVDYARVKNINDSGWPQDYWAKPSRVAKDYWISNTGHSPRHKYAYQVGHDDDYVYVRLIASAPKSAVDSRQYKLSVEFYEENEKNFELKWNVDRSPSGVTTLSRANRVNTWSRKDSKGNIHCYAVFNRDDINSDSWRGYGPRIHMEIEEYVNGQSQGRFMMGGIANKGSAGTIGFQFGNPINVINTAENYQFRENIYNKSKDIFPQGLTLARWFNSRRSIHGYDNNIQYMKDMAKRCKDSTALPNILSCLLWEHLRKWKDEHPDVLDVDDEFIKYRDNVVKQLVQFCDSNGIKKEARDYGLSYFVFELFPYTNYYYSSRGLRSEGSREDRHGFTIPLQNHSPFVKRSNIPHAIHFFPGLYHARPAKFVEKMHLHDVQAYIGEVAYVTPSSKKVFLTREGEFKNELKPPNNHRGKSGTHRMVNYQYNKKVYRAMSFDNRGRGLVFQFPKIQYPAIPEAKYESADVLYMIENLPSDSQIGHDLVYTYWNCTPEEKRKDGAEIWDIVLRQIGSNRSNSRRPDVIRQLFNTYRGKKLPNQQIYKKVEEHLRKHKIERNLQRQIFTEYNNNMRGSERWYNLGAILKQKDAFLGPTPEDQEDPLAKTYKYNDESFHFQSSTKKMEYNTHSRFRLPKSRSRDRAFSYHHMTFELLEKKKIWMYLQQQYPHRYGAIVKMWVDGNMVFEGRLENGVYTPLAIPVRLEAGQHKLLIYYDYVRGWDLQFAIGNSGGLPLEIINLPNQIPTD